MYSKKVIKLFQNPKHVGEIKNPSSIGEVGNPRCVLPGVLIYTNPNIKKIKEIKNGKKVIGKDGNYHKISKVFKRKYKGNVCEINTFNLGKTIVTPEHNIYALKINKETHKWKNREKYYPADWFNASHLRKGDFILYPIPKETKDMSFIKLNIPKPKWDFKSFTLPEKIPINDDFLRLIGYYLAEGDLSTKKCKGYVGFSFNSQEQDYIQDVQEIIKRLFNLETKIRKEKDSCYRLAVYSARLARFFEREFNKGAKNKKLPQWAMLLPIEKQKSIICGLWRGDGYLRDLKGKYVTISKQLAYQLRNLLLRQKIIFSFLTIPEKGIHKENYCIYIRDKDALKKLSKITGTEINVPERRRWPKKSWFENGFYHLRIKNVNIFKYEGDVYDLNVDDSHSFVSESCLLHNCGDMMKISIKVDKEKIRDIRFKTYGCVAAIAASEALCILAKNKTLKEALKITPKQIDQELDGLPPIKHHCTVLGMDALKKAIQDYEKNN